MTVGNLDKGEISFIGVDIVAFEPVVRSKLAKRIHINIILDFVLINFELPTVTCRPTRQR